jgi:5-methylcytosine-specific restriction endonuclease McrA
MAAKQRTPEQKAIQAAYKRAQRARRSPEEKQRQQDSRRARRVTITREEQDRRNAAARALYAKRSSEKREGRRAAILAKNAILTPEQIKKRRAYQREWAARRLKQSLSQEQKERRKIGTRARTAKLTPDEKERRKLYHREHARQYALDITPEKRAARSQRKRQQYVANPEKAQAHNRNTRARRRRAPGRHTAADVRHLFEVQRGACAGCDAVLVKGGKGRYHVDHVMPLALGGSNWPENLQLLCPPCNHTKHAKHPDDWAATRRRRAA